MTSILHIPESILLESIVSESMLSELMLSESMLPESMLSELLLSELMHSELMLSKSMLAEQSGTTPSRLEILPAEMLVKVYRCLPLFDRISLARSSKHLAAVATKQKLLTFDLEAPSPAEVRVIREEAQPFVRIQFEEPFRPNRWTTEWPGAYLECATCQERFYLGGYRDDWSDPRYGHGRAVRHIIGHLTRAGRYVTTGHIEVVASGLRMMRRRYESAIENAACVTLRYKT